MRPGLLLGRLGGGQPDLLRESAADAARFGSMGAVLIGTAAMAALSATFALTTAVELALPAAAVVGVLWGALILSLDRMLVISMGRQDGFWRSAGAAVPRLALALLIGGVISVPLVLRIFEPELDNELQVIHNENLVVNQQKLDARFADIAPMENRVAELQKAANGQATLTITADPDVAAAQKAVDDAQKAYDTAAEKAQCELDGRCGSGKPGDGEAYRSAKAAADIALTRLQTAQSRLAEVTETTQTRIGGGAASAKEAALAELATLVPRLDDRKAARDEARDDLDEGEEGNTGLLVRLEALERLSDGHPTMWTAHLALIALFACIELLPVLAKLLSGRSGSLYERLLEMREERAEATEKKRQSWQDQIDQQHFDARLELEADRLKRQGESGRRANEALALRQEQVAQKAIEVWGQLAVKKTDAELARWYHHHIQSVSTALPPIPPTQAIPAQTAGSNPVPPATGQPSLNGQQPGTATTPPAPVGGP